MKHLALVAQLMAWATSALAMPIDNIATPANYNIQVICPTNDNLQGRLLTVNDTVVGLRDDSLLQPLQVYVTDSSAPDQIIIHAVANNTTLDQVLTVDGTGGLQPLILAQTQGADINRISYFRNDTRFLHAQDGGKWVALPQIGGWSVSWYDGQSFLIQDYFPIELALIAAQS